ncbi:MAG: porin, partial [Candidatus Nomurabacteria bacterium]|nr:porin [Candidatus Nomurabacteria bacterium]
FQEAWLRFGFRKEAQLVVGQFKPPFGRERFTPDFLILTIDRSLVTDALTPDGPYIDSFYRDRGVQLDGEPRPGLRYAVAAFDGRGANHQFHGIGPLLAGQVTGEVLRGRPVLGRPLTVQIGTATAFRWGRDLPFRPCCAGELAPAMEHFRGADRRWDAEFSGDWGDVSVRAEYMRAHLDFDSTGTRDLVASGWYVLGAKHISRKWQLIAKYERFDPDTNVASNKDVRQTTLGLNHYIRQNRFKVMAGYVIRQERVRPIANNLFQVQLQYFLH